MQVHPATVDSVASSVLRDTGQTRGTSGTYTPHAFFNPILFDSLVLERASQVIRDHQSLSLLPVNIEENFLAKERSSKPARNLSWCISLISYPVFVGLVYCTTKTTWLVPSVRRDRTSHFVTECI